MLVAFRKIFKSQSKIALISRTERVYSPVNMCYDIIAKCLIHIQNLNNFKFSMQSVAKITIF